MLQEILTPNVIAGIVTVLVALLGGLASYITVQWKKKIDIENDLAKADKIKKYIDFFKDLVIDIVSELENTLVPLLNRDEDGRLSSEDIDKLYAAVLKRLKAESPKYIIDLLETSVEDFDGLLQTFIESAVLMLKFQQKLIEGD